MDTINATRLWTVEDYHKMGEIGIFAPEERVELIEGIVYNVADRSPGQSWTRKRLNSVLITAFSGRYSIGIQSPVILSNYSELEPDGSIVMPLRDGDLPQIPHARNVYLVVEISDSDLLADRTVRMPLYANASIPEMWIINIKDNVIEQYTKPQGREYQKVRVWQRGDYIPTTLEATLDTNEILLATL